MTVFNWLLIFKDGAHVNSNGEKLVDACEAADRSVEDIAISRAGFPRGIPLHIPAAMSEETKDKLKTLSAERRSLRNSGKRKKKKSAKPRSGWGFQPIRK